MSDATVVFGGLACIAGLAIALNTWATRKRHIKQDDGRAKLGGGSGVSGDNGGEGGGI